MNKDKITFAATANNSKKTYTKFRTLPMNQQAFDLCWYNTDGDWKEFLKSEEYVIIESYFY